MSAASAPSWPGSRALLGWWRELLDRQPRQLWFSHLLVHRVEVPVRVARSRSLDFWQRALLRQFGTRIPHGGSLENSLGDLHLDRQVLAQLVRELTAAGLLHNNGTGLWDLTDLGRHALQTGSLAVRGEERRTLHFVDNAALHRPPHFLPLLRPPHLAAFALSPAMASARFEIASLEACVRQTPEWKARHRFPADIEALLSPRSGEPSTVNWQRVVLDSLGTLALVLVRTAASAGEPSGAEGAARLAAPTSRPGEPVGAEGAARLAAPTSRPREPSGAGTPVVLGFVVRMEGWILEPEPILTLAEGWEEVLPDLAEEPSPEAWHRAWQAWCQPRSQLPADVEACRLERADHRLLVHAPPRLLERLRAARSDAVKQEAWLLAGDGRTRSAARIDLQPLEASR